MFSELKEKDKRARNISKFETSSKRQKNLGSVNNQGEDLKVGLYIPIIHDFKQMGIFWKVRYDDEIEDAWYTLLDKIQTIDGLALKSEDQGRCRVTVEDKNSGPVVISFLKMQDDKSEICIDF